MESIREASPRLKARIAGVFDLLEMLTGGFAILLVGGARSLSIDGNSRKTATLCSFQIARIARRWHWEPGSVDLTT